jgi:hypothetical protein
MGSQQQIIGEIEAYICRGGGKYQDWYIGIADDPIGPIDEALLFHKVENHRFICLETISQQVAIAVADYFVNILGTDGNLYEGNRGKPCQFLYIYKKAVHTTGYKIKEPIRSICLERGTPSWLRSLGNKVMRYLYAS